MKIFSDTKEKGKRIKWGEVAFKLSKMTSGDMKRIGKHCRERWHNHLDPILKKF